MNTQSPLLSDVATPTPARASLLARLGRRLLLKQLAGFTRGELRVVEPSGEEFRFGRRSEEHDLACTL